LESNGKKFRKLVAESKPLQIVGTVNAYSAILAEKVGHQSIYLSGGGVAASSLGVPDLGITTLSDVLEDAKRITQATSLPLLVDVDTGWGGAFNIVRCVREMTNSGKRCGHRPNKAIVSTNEMLDRIKAAVDAKTDSSFVIIARTDALAIEGMQSAIDKSMAFSEAGADMIFPEALNTIEQYRDFSDSLNVPILANITEFGQTPLYSKGELFEAGVDMVLYPLSAFRAMSNAALNVYQHILEDGHQKNVLESMQTREELYDFLNYHQYEGQLDELINKENK